MDNLHLYTKAELELMLIRHKEGSVIFPARILKEIKREIARKHVIQYDLSADHSAHDQ